MGEAPRERGAVEGRTYFPLLTLAQRQAAPTAVLL